MLGLLLDGFVWRYLQGIITAVLTKSVIYLPYPEIIYSNAFSVVA